LFVSGLDAKWLFVLLVLVLIAGIALIFAEPYRMERLFAFIDPWKNPKAEGYQLIQSYFALGNGGLFGVGLFNSRQKYLFLPFAESDFIF
ncbi:MAG: FtsW/RodA/SpoVE family cell cycle protein, partial [Clostridia bacterium]|nr:FtsW/RodA/SpoVE family cell cycle protein [Clostridia bacterium]